jgi:hypothetical protein
MNRAASHFLSVGIKLVNWFSQRQATNLAKHRFADSVDLPSPSLSDFISPNPQNKTKKNAE